jgi:pyrroloquinoline quinone biosynthesis protein E
MLAELTHRCPLQCPYCSNPIDLNRRSEELTTDEWRGVFQQSAALGVLQVHLSGGEPTLRRDLVDIIAAAHNAGLYSNLITAGVRLSRERLVSFADAGLDHVQVSIQDSDAQNADHIANMKGAFDQKLATARWVRELDLPLTANVVVHRQNLDHIEDIIDLALRLGAHRLEIANVQYYGWAIENRALLMPTPEQVAQSTSTVERARESLRGRMVIDHVVPDYYARRPKRCMDGWGSQFFAVTPRGRVLPCHAAETITGMRFSSVRERSLAWIWRNDEAFNRFRGVDWMPEPCRSCEYRDRDLGGCRCQAFAFTGDAAATDPVCERSPHHVRVLDHTGSGAAATLPHYQYRRYRAKPSATAAPHGGR